MAGSSKRFNETGIDCVYEPKFVKKQDLLAEAMDYSID